MRKDSGGIRKGIKGERIMIWFTRASKWPEPKKTTSGEFVGYPLRDLRNHMAPDNGA